MIKFHLNNLEFRVDAARGSSYVKDNYLRYTIDLEHRVVNKNYQYLFSMGRFYIYHDSSKAYSMSNQRRSLLL